MTTSEPIDRARLDEAQKKWQAPADLAGAYVPRTAKYTRGGMFAFVGAGALMAVTIGLIGLAVVMGTRAQDRRDLLAREGVAAQASITRKWETGGRSHTRNIGYAYDAGAQHISAHASVTTGFYKGAVVGATTGIHYAASRPEISHLDAGTIDSPGWVPLIGILPMLALLIIPLLAFRQKKLLETGTATAAVVTGVSPMKGGYAVSYSFLDSHGRIVNGRTGVGGRDRPSPGDTITALYQPEQPRNSAMYPLKFAVLDS